MHSCQTPTQNRWLSVSLLLPTEMAVGSESGRHEIFLFDLDEATDYYVESSGVRSPVYRIDVADLPYVQRIDLEIRYPAYAGLSPATIEDGGDIAALRGSQVTLTILPTLAVTAGRLIVDGEEPAPLEPLPDGRLSGALRVQRQGYYRIELEG